MEIELHLEGTPQQLRDFADRLQASLGIDGEVRAWLGTADPEDEPKVATVYVDVPGADDEEAALQRVQPAVREADPDFQLLRGGTSTMRLIVPMQAHSPPDAQA
jgi:hypothetical protein